MTTSSLRFVRVIITDSFDNILAMAEKRKGIIWNLPGGRVESDETFESAATREIQEETGLIILSLEFLFKKTILFNDNHWIGKFYKATDVKGVPSVHEPEKCVGLGYFSLDVLYSLPSDSRVLYEPAVWYKERFSTYKL